MGSSEHGHPHFAAEIESRIGPKFIIYCFILAVQRQVPDLERFGGHGLSVAGAIQQEIINYVPCDSAWQTL